MSTICPSHSYREALDILNFKELVKARAIF